MDLKMNFLCETCQLKKHKCDPFVTAIIHTIAPFGLIHNDV